MVRHLFVKLANIRRRRELGSLSEINVLIVEYKCLTGKKLFSHYVPSHRIMDPLRKQRALNYGEPSFHCTHSFDDLCLDPERAHLATG